MANEEKKSAPPAKAKAAVKKVDGKPSVGKRIAKWFREMRSELKKVIWPTPKQTANNTAIALVMMMAAAVVIWGFDRLASAIVQAVISLAG